MGLNGWDGWAFGLPNHPYAATTWGPSHYRKHRTALYIGTQSPRFYPLIAFVPGSPYAQSTKGKGGASSPTPSQCPCWPVGFAGNILVPPSGLRCRDPHAGSDTRRGAAAAAYWDSLYQRARYRCIDSTLPRHVNVAS